MKPFLHMVCMRRRQKKESHKGQLVQASIEKSVESGPDWSVTRRRTHSVSLRLGARLLWPEASTVQISLMLNPAGAEAGAQSDSNDTASPTHA